MTQIANNTNSQMLKAISPVKGVADSTTNSGTDDAQSFKDVLMKQFAPNTADSTVVNAKHPKPIKAIRIDETVPVETPTEPAEVLLINDVKAEDLVDQSLKVAPLKSKEDDLDKTQIIAIDNIAQPVSQTAAVLINTNNPAPNIVASESKLEDNKQLAAIDNGKAVLRQPIVTSDNPVDKADEIVADGAEAYASQDLTKLVNSTQAKTVDSHDFAKTLSHSLAKSAEMNDSNVNTIPAQVTAQPANGQQVTASLITQATLNANQPNLNINTYFGSAGWDKEVNQKVVWMVGGADQSATLTLNPPDLGPVQVVINVNNDKADTTFISDNPEVRQALQDGVDNLREMLKQSGVELGQANINSNQQHQDNQQNAEQSRSAFASRMAGVTTTAEREVPQVSTVRISRALPGQVDIFA